MGRGAGRGHLGADLVGHDGGKLAFTLVTTELWTQWTEPRAVPNKTRSWVFQQLLLITGLVPFDVRGIQNDNGSEFINHHLFIYCADHALVYTRSRVGRKNDNGFVEQKNNDVVRKHVGYLRYNTAEQVELHNERYERLLINFFYPVREAA